MDRDSGSHTNARLFYALWPDAATRAALIQLQAGLQGRKTSLQNLHMTLAFLGSRPRKLLPLLEQILTQLDYAEVALRLDRLGYFPQKQIAWAGISSAPETLMELQRSLIQNLAQHGVSINQQSRFKPHVTLARDETTAPVLAQFATIRWRANEVVLVESVMQAAGASYRVLASHKLRENE